MLPNDDEATRMIARPAPPAASTDPGAGTAAPTSLSATSMALGGSPDAPAVPPPPVLPGQILGHTYEIEARLARGGMGEVFRARHTELGSIHAIKVILPDLVNDQRIVGMFKEEAKKLRKVRNDAVVAYEGLFRDESGRRYLVMEFVDGISLAQVIKERALSPQEVRELRDRVAMGLAAAHDKFIYHRDISPDNIILVEGRTDLAKVIDFGIAKSADPGDRTVIGQDFAGKYSYVSPEQLGLFGHNVDGRSDIYSLGLVLVAAAQGRALDMGNSPISVIEARRSVPDLGGIPEELRAEIAPLLEPNPADRPQSMRELPGAGVPIGATSMAATTASARPAAMAAAAPVAQSVPPTASIEDDFGFSTQPAAPPPKAPPVTPHKSVLDAPKPASGKGNGAMLAVGGISFLAVVGAGAAYFFLTQPAPQPTPTSPGLTAAAPALTPAPSVTPTIGTTPPTAPVPSTPATPPVASPPAPPPAPVVQPSVTQAPPATPTVPSQPAAPQVAVAAPTSPPPQPSAPPPAPPQPAIPQPAVSPPAIPQATTQPIAPPVVVPSAPPAATAPQVARLEPGPQARAALTSAVQGVVASYPCSDLSTAVSEDLNVQVTGFVSRPGDLGALKGALGGLKDVKGVGADGVAVYPWPDCSLLKTLQQNAGLTDGRGALKLDFSKPSHIYRNAEKVSIKASIAVPRDGFLYVDYVDNISNQVVHMLPTKARPSNAVKAGQTVAIGTPATGDDIYGISEPFGLNLVIAVWSPRPLFDKPREDDEPADKYLQALDARIKAITGAASAYTIVTTTP